MSDESRTSRPETSIHVNHWCSIEGCDEWGSHGFARGRAEPRWWCWEHFPNKPNKARDEAASIADMQK